MLKGLDDDALTYVLAVKAAKEYRIVSLDRVYEVLKDEMDFADDTLDAMRQRAIQSTYMKGDMSITSHKHYELVKELKRSKTTRTLYETLLGGMRRNVDAYHKVRKARKDEAKAAPKSNLTYQPAAVRVPQVEIPKKADGGLVNPSKQSSEDDSSPWYKQKPDNGVKATKPRRRSRSKAKNIDITTPPKPISVVDPLSLEEFAKLVIEKMDPEMEYEIARSVAEHVMGFFGYQTLCVDKTLSSEDRQLFYLLEDYGILSNGSEETTLYDGRDWRIHFWIFSDELNGKLVKNKDDSELEDLYNNIFSQLQ